MSLCFLKKRNWEECVAWARASLEFDKNNLKGYLRMTHAFIQIKDTRRASDALRKLEDLPNLGIQVEVDKLKRAIQRLELTERKVDRSIQRRTAQKLVQSASHCECNSCKISDFPNRAFKFIEKDPVLLAQYREALGQFQESLNEAEASSSGASLNRSHPASVAVSFGLCQRQISLSRSVLSFLLGFYRYSNPPFSCQAPFCATFSTNST